MASGGREGETALWLHNKLGSTDDLWSGRSICSQLSKEKFQHIIGCFRSLQPHVKVKLLLSFLHIPKRNIADDGEWKSDLDEIIELAVDDRDQWVSTVGEILKTYPTTFLVNSTDLSGSSTFHSMYTELKKIVRKSTESATLPLECRYLGKTALASSVNQVPSTHRHFSLKRKPKSSALRADLLIKSQEIQNSTKRGLPTSNIPMKIRSTAKRMDVEMATTQTPSLNPGSKNGSASVAGFLKAKTLSTFSSSHRHTPSLAMRKEGGAKMLDISEMPPTGKEAKRRKKLEEQEAAAQAKKEREEAAAAERAAAAAKTTPDYAAGLGVNSTIKTGLPSTPRANLADATPSYLPNATTHVPANLQTGYGREAGSHAVPPPHQPPTIAARPPINVLSHPATTTHKIRMPANPQQPAGTAVHRIGALGHLARSVQNQSHIHAHLAHQQHTNPAEPVQHNVQHNVQQNAPAAAAAAQPAKKTLSLTKELMQEAQEMFRNSNKVSRPEKALILGFMAGSRDNPCPTQGHIVNIRLSENMEPVRLQDGSVREMMIESYFQMNYHTGEWKRIKKPKEPLSVMSV